MKSGALSFLAIDAAGGILTALLLGTGAWTGLLRPADGGQSTRELADLSAAAKHDLAALRLALNEQKALEARHQNELAAVGAMPGQAPPETYLRALSTLAAENHLGVVRQLPLSARHYPGLLEERFAYEVTGTMPDLARFFKAIELSSSWTDISYMKIDQGKTASPTDRNALLTFSVFSMAKDPPAPAVQGG